MFMIWDNRNSSPRALRKPTRKKAGNGDHVAISGGREGTLGNDLNAIYEIKQWRSQVK